MATTSMNARLRTADLPLVNGRASAGGRDSGWPHHALLSAFVFLWAGNFVLAELALREMMPISFSAARLVAGGASMLALLSLQIHLDARRTGVRQGLFRAIRREDWPRLLLVSVLGAALAPWLGIEGLNLTHSSRAALWLALGPVLSCAVGHFWRTERIGWVGSLGAVLAGLGTLALAADGVWTGKNWLGDAFLLLSLLLTVVELHLAAPLVARYGATFTVASRTAIGGFLYLVIAAPAMAAESWSALSGWTWIAILLGGVVGVGAGQWAKLRAVRVLGPTRVILYGNLVPLATLALAWMVIGSRPSALEVAAGGVIVAGALCLQGFGGMARRGGTRETAPGVAEAVIEDL